MPRHPALRLVPVALATLSVGAATSRHSAHAGARCTLVPGPVTALLRVERDTLLPHGPREMEAMSASRVRPGPHDTLVATTGTPMPAARVRLLAIDSATRARLVGAGITDAQPAAFIRAAPYRADCRTVRWSRRDAWVVPGDVGYARATLAPTDQWVGGAPVLVIADAWNYPYPRQRGLAYGVAPDESLASAEAMYGLEAALAGPPGLRGREDLPDGERRQRALAWAAAHAAEAEHEPVRSLVRDAILDVDLEAVMAIPSRLRGTYRVTLESGGVRDSFHLRTYAHPRYRWRERETVRTTAELVASPHAAGYTLAGHLAIARDALPVTAVTGHEIARAPLGWISAADRPTAPGNASRTALPGELEVMLGGVPRALWTALDGFAPPVTREDSLMRARMGLVIPREQEQRRLPLTLRLDAAGGVRADTTLARGGRRVRVTLARVDTTALPND